MEFKLCECILPNGEMCARYIEKKDDLYCCKHINLNTEQNEKIYNEPPTFSTSVCSVINIFLMSLSILFFCGKKKKNKKSLHNAFIPFNEEFNHSLRKI